MADAVAIVSVISSAAVGIGTLATSYLGSRAQRRHERITAFESHVWDSKLESHTTAIAACRTFALRLESIPHEIGGPGHGAAITLAAANMRAALDEQAPYIDVFASEEARKSLQETFRRCDEHRLTSLTSQAISKWDQYLDDSSKGFKTESGLSGTEGEERERFIDSKRRLYTFLNTGPTPPEHGAELLAAADALADALRASLRGMGARP